MRIPPVRALGLAITALATMVALGVLASSGVAQAQQVPTKGQAPQASGGQAWTRMIADLKKFDTEDDRVASIGPCGSEWAGYVVCEGDYDDDPLSFATFHVAPNPADDPLQHAWKILYFDFHDQECLSPPVIQLVEVTEVDPASCSASNDIQAIQKEIFWKAPHPFTVGTGPDANPAGQRVLHEVVEARLTNGLVNPEVILTGVDCNVLGAVGINGTIADGLVQTGQVEAANLNDMIAKCIQNEGGFHLNNWTISKHLPPGRYDQCVTLLHTNGSETDRVCVEFKIMPVDHYVIDFADAGVSWVGLRLNNKSVHSGDFNLETANYPTIQGDGNTSLVYSARFQTLENEVGKRIWSDFDGQINRKKNAGTPPQIVEWEHIDGIASTDASGAWSPWAVFDGPTTLAAGVTQSSGAVCLEPNEPLKLDFSLTPKQTVWAGVYSGAIEVQATRDTSVCTPSLDQGESPTGDPNVFDNNPSQGGPGAWTGGFFTPLS
ncbi:MAG: hypothetical protein IT299_13440 [Dehalococcoidia bacterium]|nr:hypothetical protein [Dehalococcoidia bacterium]